MTTALDHITVISTTLAAGADFVRESLGVEPRPGGSHPRMGTHNLLLSLGGSMFLEVISVDPSAPKPARPRWFDLDAWHPDTPPRLAAWVVHVEDIEGTVARCPPVFGSVEVMTRGALRWLITIPSDGHLPLGGAAPALIEWQVEPHPALALPPSGCSLVELETFHPDPARVSSILQCIGLDPAAQVRSSRGASPSLVAHIQTPQGLRMLSAAR